MTLRCMLLKAVILAVTLCIGAISVADPAVLSSGNDPETAITRQIAVLDRGLERLRLLMGVAEVQDLDLGIRSAIPRDSYFQALTLWRKTDRLLFDIVRAHAPPPSSPTGEIAMQDILGVLQQAEHVLHRVADELHQTDETEAAPPPVATDPFSAILNLNRRLDALLERHFAPSDVYMEITLAMGHAARLLARYPDAIRIPEEPPFEPNKRPADVYRRLTLCLQSIIRIFHKLDLPVLTLDASRTEAADPTPSDVFAIASLIVSQLDFLHRHLGIAATPHGSVYPGLKFPSHNYQRAGVLQAQLEQLECYYASAHCPAKPGGTGYESAAPQR